ncbi:MAG: hypothetical protein B1H03_00910 [Planctomycetales bacterium 4484_113]|nr:MAG: hypothetical protein B1H03_00910 [Planctomycetales bacterium 4484_113]
MIPASWLVEDPGCLELQDEMGEIRVGSAGIENEPLLSHFRLQFVFLRYFFEGIEDRPAEFRLVCGSARCIMDLLGEKWRFVQHRVQLVE